MSCRPVGLAWENEGATVYVAEAAAGRVSRLSIVTGMRETIADGVSQPESLAVMPDGRIVVAEVGAQNG